MNRVFVTADTHFGHKKILEFESVHRPFKTIEEHDEELIRRWNEVVGPKDTVWHLGDVLFGQEAFKTLGRLNGNKKLIMGNHDGYSTCQYLKYFIKVLAAVRYDKCLLTHIPIHPDQFHRFLGNIHGHLHSSSIKDRRYACVSVEHTNLAPIPLREVIARF